MAENGSVMPARFNNTYKCTKIQSYLLVNCVKFLSNPFSISLRYRLARPNTIELGSN